MNETWDTFAPRPKAAEQYLKAVVQMESGDTKIYSFPRMEDLSWGARYQKERYRKFIESVLCRECSGLWPDIERSVAAREFDPVDPPDKVILIEFKSVIDPSTGAIGSEAAAKPTVLSELYVEPGDLR